MANKRILLVEGIDDAHVFKHICGNRGLPQLDEVKSHGGVSQLLDSFPVRLKASEDSDVLGVVVDADAQIASRWASLHDRIVDAGYRDVPRIPMPGGTVVAAPIGSGLPRVGIWIMPDNQATGILEDFLRFLVPANSPLLAHVESSIASIPVGEVRFNATDRPKAVIHTWLAWQQESGKPLGTAITARYLDPGVPQVDVLVSWLRNLFFP